eukprot:CAMPEP_0170368480 /NCGR_PEP_ID=MMETSP0117_2-20130122/7478_1 /TAXON_ID=400756 /ORGANISM="Durinskia baltica, Strain CSIRO CS-38" /LENGTH=722 /DNA_ID=CAMNT_0010623147 /DNA_START=477 /DNA_END=2645 /DNA_ORIENTATION=+
MMPSGQNFTVPFYDPKKKASGTVDIFVEHEPRVLIENMPSFSETFRRLFRKQTVRAPLPPSVLDTNQDKLNFLKSKKLDHHRSAKYDGSDDGDDDDDTRSESENSADANDGSPRAFNESFIITSHALSNRDEAIELDDHMFVLEEHTSERQNSNSQKVTDTPRSVDSSSVSTITMSAKDCTSPIAAYTGGAGGGSNKLYRPSMSDVPEEGSGVISCNYVPFSAGDGNHTSEQASASEAIEEEWEQPPEDWLNSPVEPPVETPTYKVPPPIITDPKVLRMQRHGSDQILVEQEQQQLKRRSESPVPARPMQPPVLIARANSQPQPPTLKPVLSAKEILEMSRSEDDRDAQMLSSLPPSQPSMPVLTTARPTGRTIKVPVRLGNNNNTNNNEKVSRMVVPPLPMPPQAPIYHRAQSAPEMASSVSVKELRRNFERPPLPRDASGSISSANSSNRSDDSNLEEPGARMKAPPREVARSDSERSYSTISTHEYIPKQPGGSTHGKMVIPVRLKTAAEEARYTGKGMGDNSHHLHRTATAPVLRMTPPSPPAVSASYQRSAPPSRNADVSSPPPYNSAPVSGEKAVPVYRQHSTGQQAPHALHRTATAPALGPEHEKYARDLQAAAYGNRAADSNLPYRPTPAPSVPTAAAPVQGLARGQSSSRIMAPPIRLQSNSQIPADYQRFTHIPGEVHHRHHHSESREQYHGEALRERVYGRTEAKASGYAR